MKKSRIITIGHSPDPDDAFMFHALTSKSFETPGFEFIHELQDIETLNQRALRGELEVSAISIHAFPEVAEKYSLMNCGASMGEGYGPMIVAKPGIGEERAKLGPIGIPGLKTSAYLGLRLAWGDVPIKVVPFDKIIDEIMNEEIVAGLIIHEGQLTYVDYGLNVILDLGVWWANENKGWPMPLGGNIVRKDLGGELMAKITNWTKKSIQHALENPSEALEFAKKWGRGIDDITNQKFVNMYVNDRTIDYKEEGRASVKEFLRRGQEIGMISSNFKISEIEFIGI